MFLMFTRDSTSPSVLPKLLHPSTVPQSSAENVLSAQELQKSLERAMLCLQLVSFLVLGSQDFKSALIKLPCIFTSASIS